MEKQDYTLAPDDPRVGLVDPVSEESGMVWPEVDIEGRPYNRLLATVLYRGSYFVVIGPDRQRFIGEVTIEHEE